MLDVRQLDALAAVVDHGGFKPAAQALRLTLAAVSLRIKALEQTLGRRLLVRGKSVRATAAGQALLSHVRRLRMMEADLLASLPGAGNGDDRDAWQTLSVAVNADSASAWFLPGVAPLLRERRLLIDLLIDDQDHTHDALRSGDAMGCVSTLDQAMRGCVAEPLGRMRYRAVAAPTLRQRLGELRGVARVTQLMRVPAIIFNRKDALHDRFLADRLGLRDVSYPRHYAPSLDAFATALGQGLGWGMVPELHLGGDALSQPLEDVMPGHSVDLQLFWHHWEHEPPTAQLLTKAVRQAAERTLIQD